MTGTVRTTWVLVAAVSVIALGSGSTAGRVAGGGVARTSWSPTALAVPLDHLAMAVARYADGRVVPGRFFSYDYDGIGNREHEVAGSGARQTYANDPRNQIDSRTVPGQVRLAGYTNPTYTVELGCSGTTYPTHRDGGRWYGVVPVDNSSGPVAATIVVNLRAPGGALVGP